MGNGPTQQLAHPTHRVRQVDGLNYLAYLYFLFIYLLTPTCHP